MTSPQGEPTEREAFEAHMRRQNACTHLGRHPNEGAYRTITVERAWQLWQAARASQSAPAPVEDKDGARLDWALDEANSLIYNQKIRKWRAFGDEGLNYFDNKIEAIDAAIDRALALEGGAKG